MALEILYRDDVLVAVYKPSGLFVHPSNLDRLAPSCLPLLRDQLGQWVYPVHRLDRGTSGVVLFALRPETARALGVAFETRLVQKEYLALVRGYLSRAGQVDYAYCPPEASKPVSAVTDYVCLATVELPFAVGRYETARYSLMQAMPLTGRRHQIRRHCAHLRHPIVNDRNYGDLHHNRFFTEHFGIERLMLMATCIRFSHPDNGRDMTVRAPIPERICRLFAQFGWDDVAGCYGSPP